MLISRPFFKLVFRVRIDLNHLPNVRIWLMILIKNTLRCAWEELLRLDRVLACRCWVIGGSLSEGGRRELKWRQHIAEHICTLGDLEFALTIRLGSGRIRAYFARLGKCGGLLRWEEWIAVNLTWSLRRLDPGQWEGDRLLSVELFWFLLAKRGLWGLSMLSKLLVH